MLSHRVVIRCSLAGTGKTVLLRQIIQGLKDKFGTAQIPEESAVMVTASTGMAACAIRGITLHAFAGTGRTRPHAVTIKTFSKSLRNKFPQVVGRWQFTQVLVIDESESRSDCCDVVSH